jgi:DNA-damage-inducible protein D
VTQTPDFDSIKQINPYGVEYWSARDLMPLLGYKKWQKFEDAIKRAMTACTQSGNIANQHFTDAGKTSPMPHGGVRAKADYNLSRFACYLIAQNGDPRKPEIAAAQAYFAASTRAHEIHQLREEQRARLEKRLEVSESFNALGRVAQNAGVQSKSFGIFIDAGYVGLYRHSLQELKELKGVPENEEYLDHISRKELSAIDFKNELTIGKLQDDCVKEEEKAIETHYYMGDVVREAIKKAQQPLPETLPTEPSIRKLVEEHRRKQKRALKIKDEQEGQPSLFDRVEG